jgi:hypothetical protein
VTGSFEAMMRGGAIVLIKRRHFAPESVECGKRFARSLFQILAIGRTMVNER